MLADDFKFKLSVSDQSYADHPKKTNAKLNGITFRPKDYTIETLLEDALNGKVFCPTFKSQEPDLSFSIKEKTRDNYVSTSTLFFDFDNMDMTMQDFIEKKVEYKPSFGYTTYDNGVDGYRFRLGYVFNWDIVGEHEFKTLFNAILTANDFPIEDREHGGVDTRTIDRCEQCYFGTLKNANYYYNKGEGVYTKFDFEKYIKRQPVNEHSRPILNPCSITIDKEFLQDFKQGGDSFVKKYHHQFYPNYYSSLETELILDDSEKFYTFPDDYVAVMRKREGKNIIKWNIGEDRKKKLFITAQIMRKNCPSLTIENLLYNLFLERKWYYINADNKIDNDILIQIATNSFKYSYSLNPTKHGSYKCNKEYWLNQGISLNQAKMYVRHYIKVREVRKFFNPFLSIKKNVALLNSNGVKISERTLRRMVSDGDIKINNEKPPIPYLSCCHDDATIRITNAIVELLREDGTRTQSTIAEMLNLDIRTIKRYFKNMNGKQIYREGNNRTGKWIVLEQRGETVQDIESVSFSPNLSEQTI